jgi:hypothetical protein
MIVLGLVHDRGWEPPDDEPAPRRRRIWHPRWRPLAWLAACCWLMVLAPAAGDAFGGLAGYGVLLLAVALGVWRVDRWCSGQYWRGLRDHQA